MVIYQQLFHQVEVLRYGSNNGDMMYWDGTAWQTIAVGSAGAVLQIIGGVPTWVSSPDITGPTITLNGNANMTTYLTEHL